MPNLLATLFNCLFLAIGLTVLPGASPAVEGVPDTAPHPPTRYLRTAPDSTTLDLTGTWTGKLFQNPGGVATEFELMMTIQHNGAFVRGTSYVRYKDIWVEMAFSGHQAPNGNIEIMESEILRSQKPKDLAWCMKQYTLRAAYTTEGITITGPWWGDSVYGPCIPGSIRLKRKVKTA